MVRPVRNALVLSFVAEALALLTGRIPWPSLLVVLASASYLVEAADHWRDELRPAPAVAISATSFSLSAGTRGLSALQQPRGTGDAAQERSDVGDGAVEVVDLSA